MIKDPKLNDLPHVTQLAIFEEVDNLLSKEEEEDSENFENIYLEASAKIQPAIDSDDEDDPKDFYNCVGAFSDVYDILADDVKDESCCLVPIPFRADDFSTRRPRFFQRKDFDCASIASKIEDYVKLSDRLDKELSADFKLRVFGGDDDDFSEVSKISYEGLWRAARARDYRLLRLMFSKKENYAQIKYDMRILSTGFAVIISEGKGYIVPPSARHYFFPTRVSVQNNCDETDKEGRKMGPKLTDELSSTCVNSLLALFEKLPVETGRMTFDEILTMLEKTTEIGDKLLTEGPIERSRQFVPYYDFCCPEIMLLKGLRDDERFAEVFKDDKFPIRDFLPLSAVSEVCPGFGSLQGKDLTSNHFAVRWLPLMQGLYNLYYVIVF